MGCAQLVRVIETTSTRKMRSVDSRLLNDGGQGMLYAVLADAMICNDNDTSSKLHHWQSASLPDPTRRLGNVAVTISVVFPHL